jgi:dTDP-4-dehydrorhamnose 3,5-epimerase
MLLKISRMFTRTETKIPGCFEIGLKSINDLRGSFTKTFHTEMYKKIDLELPIEDEPPTAIHKIVFCVIGAVNDYIVDLRLGSPTYGQWISFELDGTNPRALFIPKGTAHGYLVKSEFAIMQYKSSGVFDPKTDDAISYKSFSIAKDIVNPILSEKDIKAVSFQDFKNDFRF